MKIIIVVLMLLAIPAYADNLFDQFMNQKVSGVSQEHVTSQEETNRQLIVLQKEMIDHLKEETQEHRTRMENMQAEIDVLKKEVAEAKYNGVSSANANQQRQIDELRTQQERQDQEAQFRDLDAAHRAGEAEIQQEWNKKSMKNQIEQDIHDAIRNKAN